MNKMIHIFVEKKTINYPSLCIETKKKMMNIYSTINSMGFI